MKRVVFAGHGAFNAITERGNDKFQVPHDMTLVFWVPHGSTFVGSELDGNDPKTLLNYMFLPEVRRQLARSDRSRRDAIALPKGLTHGMPEVIRGGGSCWNYRLTPPVGLKLRPQPGDPNFITVSDRRPPRNIGYRLQYLLENYRAQCQGAEVHWAACRVVVQR
jgi:hypothetical protein